MNTELTALLDGIIDREGRSYTAYRDPQDPTRWLDRPTKYGIRDLELGEYRHLGRPATEQEVRDLEEPEARAIYVTRYIVGPRFAEIADPRLREAVIDFGINSGVQRSAWYLQRAAHVAPDMIVGPVTLTAVNALDAFVLLATITRGRVSVLTRWIRARLADRGKFLAVIDRAVSFLPSS